MFVILFPNYFFEIFEITLEMFGKFTGQRYFLESPAIAIKLYEHRGEKITYLRNIEQQFEKRKFHRIVSNSKYVLPHILISERCKSEQILEILKNAAK